MTLDEYRSKRNFQKSPEPRGAVEQEFSRFRYVVQRHKARRLHYDLRLEHRGVLLSWAVPKGPSMNPADKRLAIQTEDHPLEYLTFQGTIPKGNYGAGVMNIWDRGTYVVPDADSPDSMEKLLERGLQKGSFTIELQGERLQGKFSLARFSGDKDNWMLIKKKDADAVRGEYSAGDYGPLSSLDTEALLGTIDDQYRGEMPGDITPMLAQLSKKPFSDAGWIYELKWDGYRAIAEIYEDDVKLYSRRGISFIEMYPTVVKALKKLPVPAVLDGEIVIQDKTGRSDFQKLQHYQSEDAPYLKYNVFDLLYVDGYNIMSMPLVERKSYLKTLIAGNPVIKYTDYYQGDGERFFKAATDLGLEGIMAKKAFSTYQPGVRNSTWQKFKARDSIEAIIGGYTAPKGSRSGFGSLVLGKFNDGLLEHIGNVGSGFSEGAIQNMHSHLKQREIEQSPFANEVESRSAIRWVKPELKCHVSFTEWTNSRRLRQPVFEGLTQNIPPNRNKKNQPVNQSGNANSTPGKSSSHGHSLSIEGIEITVTNIEKVYWPESDITKGDLIAFYEQVSDTVLPHLQGRPQVLNRFPDGIQAAGFYQKEIGNHFQDWMKTVTIESDFNNKKIRYLLCPNKATLLYMANLGCIELNPWSSRVEHLDNPDYAVLDLDPDGNDFEEVLQVTRTAGNLFREIEVPFYCKTSGATGMHLYIPLNARYTYEQSRNFIKLIAQLIWRQHPKLTSLKRSPGDRKGKIYLDYLQNVRGKTLASVYSVRPVPGAQVSTPLEWAEVQTGVKPADFTIFTVLDRLEERGDIFRPVIDKGIDLNNALEKLTEYIG